MTRLIPAASSGLNSPESGGVTAGLQAEEILAALARPAQAVPQEAAFYAMRGRGDGARKLVKVSAWLAAAIRACDGRRSVAEFLEQMARDLPEVQEEQGAMSSEAC